MPQDSKRKKATDFYKIIVVDIATPLQYNIFVWLSGKTAGKHERGIAEYEDDLSAEEKAAQGWARLSEEDEHKERKERS